MSLGVQRHGPLPDPGNHLTEEELWQGHVADREKRPCLCGGYVTAVPRFPQAGVAAHRRTPRHRAWIRAWISD